MRDLEALDGWIALARLGRPRGNRGEVTAIGFAGEPERYMCVRTARLFGTGDQIGRAVEIESAWEHQGRLILKFRGIDTISQAEELAGTTLCIPASERTAPPEGEVFESDLIGCRICDRSTGRELGEVAGLEQTGAAVLLELDTGLLIPFARSICVEIDVAAKRIAVDLPDGLEDLNAP